MGLLYVFLLHPLLESRPEAAARSKKLAPAQCPIGRRFIRSIR